MTESFNLRTPPDRLAEVRTYAADHGISVNAALNVLIAKGLQAEARTAPASAPTAVPSGETR